MKSIVFDDEASFKTNLSGSIGMSLQINKIAYPVSQFSLVVDLKYAFKQSKLEKVHYIITVDIG